MKNPFLTPAPKPKPKAKAKLSKETRAAVKAGDSLSKTQTQELRRTIGERTLTANQASKMMATLLNDVAEPMLTRIAELERQITDLTALGNVTRVANRSLHSDLSKLTDMADQFVTET